MITKIKLIDDIEEEEEEEGLFKIAKIKPLTDVGLGISATAAGGGGQVGAFSDDWMKPINNDIPVSTPQPKPLFEDPKMIELHKINFESFRLWFKELKESPDKVAFLKGEGQSPELKGLREQYSKLAPYMYGKSEQWIENVSMIAIGVGMVWQLVNAAVTSGFKVKDKVFTAKELKDVLGRARAAYDFETGKFKATLSDNDFTVIKQLNTFLKTTGKSPAAREMLEKVVEKTSGLTFPQQVNIFGTKLYAGLPADEIAKSIIEVGKVTAEAVKGLDPAKAIQVYQTLSNSAIPALANEFLKAVEKPPITKEEEYAKKYGIPLDKVKVTELPKADVTGETVSEETINKLSEQYGTKATPEEVLKKVGIEPKEGLKPEAVAMGKEIFKESISESESITEKQAIKKRTVEGVKSGEAEVKTEVELASPAQVNKAYSIAKSKAMVSELGKLKPQFRKIAETFTGKKNIEKMTPEEAEMFIDSLNRLPEPKYRNGKLVPPSIPRTTKLTTQDFFKKQYGEPTPIWLLTDQTYYATKLGIKPLVEPFEKGKQEFDLEFRKSSNLVDRIIVKLNKISKTPGFERIKSKVKNIPTKAESKMAELLNKHEATPSGLSEKEEDVFKYFRNLSKDIWRRENEVREKLDLPPIKYKTAYFRHTADAMAKEMLEGKYPFPQGIKYWSEKIVGKKIFNPMEFQRKLSDDLIDLWSKDIRAVTKAMLWNGLKEIHLAEPAKFLSEQLNAISKDLPEYKNLAPREKAAYDQTRVMPASTKKWLVDYVNQVLKGQETELDASLNRIVTKSGLKGIFDKVLSPFGRAVGRTPITNTFALGGRAIISGVMGWVPRQIIRNIFQQVQNLALYGVKATLKSFLPASIDKNLKGLLSESLFLKSYTGFEELPVDLMGKLEKVWLKPYGIVAVNNAKQGEKAAYWNISELIKNPKFKKHGWADPQRTKDTPKGKLFPSEIEKLSKEMEFGSSATQYQYIPMGMPGIFRYKALIPLTRLQSWWMNYFTKFLREATHRALKGRPSWSGEDGPTFPWSRRVNFLKYLVIGGAILTALGYRKSFMLGVAPTYLSPAGQLTLGFYNYATATSDWQKKRALNQIYYSWKAFVPGSLAWRDFIAVWNGEKELEEILFYGKTEEKKKVEPTVIGKPSISKITIPKISKIKINKISPIKIKF